MQTLHLPYADIPDILRKSISGRLSLLQDLNFESIVMEHINEIHDLMIDPERCMVIFDKRTLHNCKVNQINKLIYRREFYTLNNDRDIEDSKSYGATAEVWSEFLIRKRYHYGHECEDGIHDFAWYSENEIPCIRVDDDLFRFGNTLSQRAFMMYSTLYRSHFRSMNTIVSLIIEDVINYEEGTLLSDDNNF
ncbi:MAG: hypothetical protein KAH18_03450 [Psychromonas sp.]|nr:hypothetical protein [Psychromonas sp.]